MPGCPSFKAFGNICEIEMLFKGADFTIAVHPKGANKCDLDNSFKTILLTLSRALRHPKLLEVRSSSNATLSDLSFSKATGDSL